MNLSEKRSDYNTKFNELTKLIEEIKESAKRLESSKDYNVKITQKIADSEKQLAVMSNDVDRINRDLEKLENSIDELDDQCKELSGSINQIRLSLSELLNNSQKQVESKRKFSEIFWQIMIPILGAGLLFLITVSLKSCSKPFKSEPKGVIEYKNFENK